jgi:hypothetical protein
MKTRKWVQFDDSAEWVKVFSDYPELEYITAIIKNKTHSIFRKHLIASVRG